MLTVNPKHRANIEKICTHWWVNENYDVNCLEISEELANQTPVRLDLLLSLAPPPPQLESDKLLVTGDVAEEIKTEVAPPTRSQSVGSLMELSHPAERRIKDLLNEEKASPKRKLENTVSTDRMKEGLKRKDKIIKENTVADITLHGAIQENVSLEDASMSEAAPLDKSLTQTISREMDVEQNEEIADPSLQGAACTEIIEEAKKTETKKPNKVKKTLSTSVNNKVLEGINEIPSQENVANNVDKENIEKVAQDVKPQEKPAEKPESKIATKKKTVKKKVLTDKNENVKPKESSPQPEVKQKKEEKVEEKPKVEKTEEAPTKPIERRKSRIFEAAEKFQNMITPTETKPIPIEKPKKIVIPGVSVDGFKKEFERKASLTSTSPPKLKGTASKKVLIDQQKAVEPEPSKEEPPEKVEELRKQEKEEIKPEVAETPKSVMDDERKERVRNAVSIISSALDKEGARKSKSRPCCVRKPPVPFGVSGRSASGNISLLASPLSPPLGPKPFVRPQLDAKPEVKKVEETPEPVEENKTSSAEITLKSATLPRRKTTKAEIQLNYPVPKPATMEFKTEMAHNIAAPPKAATQRSEVVVPVSGHPMVNFRASSLEPEQSAKGSPKERIIPISFEQQEIGRESVQSPPTKPPMPRPFQTQKSTQSQRSGSLSRQSTQDSDTETASGEPIRKSPREYIIPIAVEGGGYVTPRAGSLEPSDTASTTSTMTNKSRNKFGKARRMKLRSTRPKRTLLEHNDSLSSGEEDDDDGFEILTAEHLFSNLLSRVRDLTQKLNVEDGGRPGFPTSRLLSHFDHGTNFWNFHNRLDPLSRHSSLGRSLSRERNSSESSSSTPWRRSVSRDLASDIESVFKDTNSTSRPRVDNKTTEENRNGIHDYVNVKAQKPEEPPVVKKTRISKLVRPKSYPTENIVEKEKVMKVSPDKESKISKLRKGFTRQGSKERDKTKEDKNETNKNINEEEKGHKNKLLQSIEKKLEKFRSSTTSVKDSDEVKAMKEKKSSVENAIKRLREQSLPRNLEHCTESGLIKRAVSVEDLSNLSSTNKPLQASRKSVTKILGLFKKYEEQESKKNDKVIKKKKIKESSNKNPEVKITADETVIQNNKSTENNVNCNDSSQSNEFKKKPDRPRSLLFDKMKKFQSGAKSDSVVNEKETKPNKASRLPVNSFRRSLNLENVTVDAPKLCKNPDQRNLKFDLSIIPNRSNNNEPTPNTSAANHDENRNSATTDDSSAFLSPDDNDSWSVCSDYHTQDLNSPVSPNGHVCSGDENESVIDRIRRKSFYTRFNEKKRPRKPSLTRNYKDLDLYKDITYKNPTDYGSLDRRSYDYKTPLTRRSTFASTLQDPVKREYKNYTHSSSLLNDYVNVPNRYQTYNANISRPTASIYSDSEDTALDELLSAAKSRK
ncbi:hypothetical protein BDFB_000330 [Asbolus verrucosus]|uniref:Uncharacterized protein n=1 Tax=Asbolus verrucosus TaxID=1661398 RepID=A0A482WC59_ASBVE|nr:hypothetical protein BDFB_000330 [Asbolus verrucosus]